MKTIRRTTWGWCTAIILTGLLMGGCASGSITGQDARTDVSPDLIGVANTGEQIKNRRARTHDTDLRQIHDDMASILLETRPGRMNRYPIP